MHRGPFKFSVIFLFVTYVSLIHAPLTQAQARTMSPQSYAATCASLDPALMYEHVERGVAKVLTEVDIDIKTLDGKPTLFTKKVFGSAVYRGNGEFLTNNHVINPEAWKDRRIWIETDDGKKYPATALWSEAVHDLAKISIATYPPLPIVAFGTSKNLRIADRVFSVGYQFGNKIFTAGSVASLEIKITQPLMALDITFNPGASGGATFTCDGNIIGINVAKGPGIGFVIPIDVVRQIEQHMDKFKTASFGSLGVTYFPARLATPDDLQKFGILPANYNVGMLITAVRPDSAALTAGLEPGDIVVAVDNTVMDHNYRFARKIFYTPPGETISLAVRKPNGREVRLSAVIDKADDETLRSVASQLNAFDRDM